MIGKIELSDIDLDRLALVKEVYDWYGEQDHSRWVFKSGNISWSGKPQEVYLKIWNPTHVRRDNILQGIDSGFYDEQTTPALKSVIFHRGVCRGYVMGKCRPVRSLSLNERFFSLIKARTRTTGFFHAQFNPSHVMKYGGSYSLIDLEGIFPIDALPCLHKMKCYFDYKDYEDFVFKIYSSKAEPVALAEMGDSYKNKSYFRKINPVLRFSQSILNSVLGFCRAPVRGNISRIQF
ncbi:hypothetical protein [Desulfuromonas versatilis]|uniref:hypothetical protein n=1 Tax=Desulfuromonas versatilis TaxID=2802975 RepID=UPI001C860260|nr:hypothetical protein [Desulfuromonas versatilis]